MGGEGTTTPCPSPRVRGAGGEGSAADSAASPPATTLDRWATTLRDALLTELTEEDVDVTAGAEPGVLEVSTDDWTLRVEHLHDAIADEDGPRSPLLAPRSPAKRPTAWLAIDDEPEDPARYRAARRAVMSAAVDRALAQADAATDGALRAALAAGGDPFTQDLVAAM